MEERRDSLRRTFDSVARSYRHARPEVPALLLDELIRLTGLRETDHLLEIGCATGQATHPLAERGYRITCIELGVELASAAARSLKHHSKVDVVQGSFEAFRPATPGTFDLVFAASAWHWIDPELRYGKAHELLRPGGHLAFWSTAHVFPEDGDPFFREIQAIYDEIGEGLPPDAKYPRPGELLDQVAEIEATGLFRDVVLRHFDWELSYDADSYIGLLDTFSDHIAMEPWKRERLYGEIRRRLDLRPDGLLRRHWGAALHVARRVG